MRVFHRARLLIVIVLLLNAVSADLGMKFAVAEERPTLTYFALGDSYASGHGLSDDNRGSDPCRRSPSSYPYRVKEALSKQYGTIKFHHLACSGATAGPNTKDRTSVFKSLRDQFDIANAYLNHRDGLANPEPVLVTITIGANDIGLKDGDTWGQISRQWPPSSATNFFEWLDTKSKPVVSSLTPIIDTLLSHENVHIILTDYPNPFKDDAAAEKIGNFFCNDMFLSLTCDEALARTLAKLNSIMLDQFLQVNQPSHLRVAGLGAPFSGHYSTCLSPNSESWFGDDCVHPNQLGAQGIADAILTLAPTMLPAPVSPPPAQTATEAGNPEAPASSGQSAGNLPTFHLPWEAGSVWRITVGNGQGEHSNAANYHGFDAVPASGRGTDKVVSIADGVVMDFQASMPDTATVNSGHAGNCVIIDHGGSVYSIYAHLAQDSVPLSKGQRITAGTVIGTMGNSGYSTGPHLHWAVLNSAWMYTDASVSPYRTCSGRTIESRYADPDKELQEDGGLPTTGRYYESSNSPRSASGAGAVAKPTGSARQDAWTASVQVALCDAPPNSGQDMHCHGVAGVVVTIALASGEVLGSCTSGEPVQFPGGDMISLCSVDGLPFNADFVASQDPSTIPAGYEPFSTSLSLHVDNLIPGGGDQATFTFFDVRADAGSTGSAATSSSSKSEAATLLMTFRGCPDGFDPTTGDFQTQCTIPLDAPDASIIAWGDGQGRMSITQLDRRDVDGAYIYTGSSGTMNIQLSGLAPVVRNGYQVFGADGGEGGTYTIKLVNGETREIDIFYYYQ